MKTKILKHVSLAMLMLTTAVVYADDYIDVPNDYIDFSCPPHLVYNEMLELCTDRSEVTGSIPSVLMQKNDKVVIICYEKEESDCKVKKYSYVFTVTRSRNNSGVKF